MTEQLLKFASISGSVIELCAGEDHAIAKLLKANYSVTGVHTNDLYFGDRCDSAYDATDPRTYAQLPATDWIVTNPPFCDQQEIIRRSHYKARVGVALLLRVSADEMTMSDPDRYNWWANNPEALTIKMPRFSFAKSSKTGKWAVDSAYCQ